MAYNSNQQNHCSAYIHDLNRSTGVTKLVANPGEEISFNATAVLTYAAEVGECIAMVRVPKNFVVTDLTLYSGTVNAGATVGVGDPFCCGRFLGPIDLSNPSGTYPASPSGSMFNCGTAFILSKIGRGGDGCGYMYKYTCETDIILTNGYGNNTFQQGGGSVSGTSMGTGTSATLAAASVFGLKITGFVDANTDVRS